MQAYVNEVDANYAKFRVNWRAARDKTQLDLDAHDDVFRSSYRRLTSLQAWRSSLLQGHLPGDSLAFFLEAQNDALVSHTLAQVGSWRSALQALRSCLENVVVCLYYKDHPVELQLWHKGRHRLGFAAALEYFQAHPILDKLPQSLTGIDALSKEYAVLSRAVHASATSFRMTADATGTLLWSSASASVGAWATREIHAVSSVNMLLVALYRTELEGARLPGLRQAISLAIPSSRHGALRSTLKVALSVT
jgi:hypothetical protein